MKRKLRSHFLGDLGQGIDLLYCIIIGTIQKLEIPKLTAVTKLNLKFDQLIKTTVVSYLVHASDYHRIIH